MAHSSIRPKVRRRKVAHLAAYSRQFTVRNNTIKTVEKHPEVDPFSGNGSWKKEKHPQTPSLHKKGSKLVYNKETKRTERVYVKSNFPSIQGCPWKMTTEEKIERHTKLCMEIWEKKHPQPCPDDDLFKVEYQVEWYKVRDEAEKRYRDLAVSIYDKLPLTGRFKQSENKFEEKEVAQLKDQKGEGHRVNELDPSKSKLLKKAQETTNKIHAKDTKLVATNLKDHKRKKGRMILPKVA